MGCMESIQGQRRKGGGRVWEGLFCFLQIGGEWWWTVGYRLNFAEMGECSDVFVRRGCGHENLKSRVILRDGGEWMS